MMVKICGVTREEDVTAAVSLGATHLGCVLVEGTPRAVTAARAGELLADCGALPLLVFRAPSWATVMAAVESSSISCVQLHHYTESVAERLEKSGVRVHRVLTADRPDDCKAAAMLAAPAAPVHLDVGAGGTGVPFDWSMLEGLDLSHVFVAGGITPDNVSALLPHRPWGIDVSSGVESAPGRKDHGRMRALFERLAAGDSS